MAEKTLGPMLTLTPEQIDTAFETALDTFEKRIGVKFANRKLLRQAFTHESVWDPDCAESGQIDLASIGDEFLRKFMYKRLVHEYPDVQGSLVQEYAEKLMTNAYLDRVGFDMRIAQCLRLSHDRAETQPISKGTIRIMADSFEAFVGALAIEKGLDAYLVMDKIFDTFILTDRVRMLPDGSVPPFPTKPNTPLEQTRGAQGPISGYYPLARFYHRALRRHILLKREIIDAWQKVPDDEYEAYPVYQQVVAKLEKMNKRRSVITVKQRTEPYSIYAQHQLFSFALFDHRTLMGITIGKNVSDAMENFQKLGRKDNSFRMFREKYFKQPS